MEPALAVEEMKNNLTIAHISRPSREPSPEIIKRAEELVAKWRERDRKKYGRGEDKNKNSRA